MRCFFLPLGTIFLHPWQLTVILLSTRGWIIQLHGGNDAVFTWHVGCSDSLFSYTCGSLYSFWSIWVKVDESNRLGFRTRDSRQQDEGRVRRRTLNKSVGDSSAVALLETHDARGKIDSFGAPSLDFGAPQAVRKHSRTMYRLTCWSHIIYIS